MICRNCGKSNPDGVKYCIYCGAGQTNTVNTALTQNDSHSLDDDDYGLQYGEGGYGMPPQGPQKDPEKKTLMIAGIAIVAVCAVCGGIFAWMMHRDTNQVVVAAGDSTKKTESREEKSEEKKDEDSFDIQEPEEEPEEETIEEEIYQPDQDRTIRKIDAPNGVDKDEIAKKEQSERQKQQQNQTPARSDSGTHRYELVVADCTWSSAQAAAAAKGGHLLTIESLDEFNAVVNQIENEGKHKIQFLIGGRRNDGDSAYYWVDAKNRTNGNPLNSTGSAVNSLWFDTEPSYQGDGVEENCMDMIYSEAHGSRWGLNDVPNDILAVVPSFSGYIGYIVEYE